MKYAITLMLMPRRASVSFIPILALFVSVVLLIPFAAYSQAGQKSSSIVIHDSTKAANGGENATKNLREQFRAALEKEKPCVETMDDQDLRDAIQDERERAMLEGGDSTEALKMIGDRLGSSMVMNVQAMPGPGGTTVYSGFVMDTRSGRAVARAMGSESEVAESLVRQIGQYLADACKAHWAGTVRYDYSMNETKRESDGGPAHATWQNVKREKTITSIASTMIKATLLPPAADESTGSPKARVMHRIRFTGGRKEETSGKTRCREPGKNPYLTNFTQEYSETITQLGQGTDTMPVFISIDDDGSYTISVNAPGGKTISKQETTRNYSACPSEKSEPSNTAISLPEGQFTGTSFEATGRVDPKNKDVLSGSQTSPDGKTKITWKLRLVKPKGL